MRVVLVKEFLFTLIAGFRPLFTHYDYYVHITSVCFENGNNVTVAKSEQAFTQHRQNFQTSEKCEQPFLISRIQTKIGDPHF